MDALFDIGDIVRKKPRGHKMIVTFIHTPWGTGIYDAIYQSLKRQKPQCHFFSMHVKTSRRGNRKTECFVRRI